MTDRFSIFGLFCVCLLLSGCLPFRSGLYETQDSIVFETAHARWVIGTDGQNRSFISKRSNRDYLNRNHAAAFMYVVKDGRRHPSSSLQLDGTQVTVEFGEAVARAVFCVNVEPDWVLFELCELEGEPEEVRLTNLSLTIYESFGAVINAVYNHDLAVSVQAATLNVESYPRNAENQSLFEFNFMEMSRQRLPPLGDSRILSATVYASLGMLGAKVAVLTCPGTELLDTIGRFEIALSLPHPLIDDTWGKVSPEVEKSYIFVDFNEEDVDEVIRYAKQGGFGYILTGYPSLSSGHNQVDLNRFRSGLSGVKQAVQKIHSSGLKAGIHIMTAGISRHDPYVTPSPDPRLVKENIFELALDINSSTDEIQVTTDPGQKGLKTSYTYELNSDNPGLHLQIGDEIIEYQDFTRSEPYRFLGCTRGALGTTVTGHSQGDTVYHLGERWRFFVVNVESSMFGEVIKQLAYIVKECQFDMMYFDGAEIIEAQGPRFYFMNRFFWEFRKTLGRDLIFQASKTDNMSWHFLSRMASNDAAVAGIRPFLDVLRMDNIRLYKSNFMPADFGWYGMFSNGPNGYSSLPEEIEYGLVRTIAYDEPFGLQVRKSVLQGHGRTKEILELIRAYEELRLGGRVPQTVKDQLQTKRADFRLCSDDVRGTCFEQRQIGPDQFIVQPEDLGWTFRNDFSEQPLSVRIRALHRPASYGDSGNITLLDSDTRDVLISAAKAGLKSSVTVCSDKTPGTHESLRLDVRNLAAERSSWVSLTVRFENKLDLTNHRMMGTWIRGDRSGALLNLHLETPGKRPKDFYVDLDFEGWKYILIPRYEGDRVLDYQWPYVWKFALRPINWQMIDRFSLFVNGIPPETTVRCCFAPIKAIRMLENTLVNPTLEINGRRITLFGTLKQDEYVELGEDGMYRFYDSNGHLFREASAGSEIPRLREGDNELAFSCESEYYGAIVTPMITGYRITD